MQTKLLIVDTDPTWLHAISDELAGEFELEVCSTFEDARAELGRSRPDLVIANVRLGRFNGIYFAHLIRSLGLSTSCIVYGLSSDVGLAHEAQAAGAWFEPASHLLTGLRTHVRSLVAADAVAAHEFGTAESTLRTPDIHHPASQRMM